MQCAIICFTLILLLMEKVEVISIGFVYASICVANDITLKEALKIFNNEHPTGISSKWHLSENKKFRSGQLNPCLCDDYPNTRKHYLLNC